MRHVLSKSRRWQKSISRNASERSCSSVTTRGAGPVAGNAGSTGSRFQTSNPRSSWPLPSWIKPENTANALRMRSARSNRSDGLRADDPYMVLCG